MPRIRAVYDTNVYRAMSQSRFAELRRMERRHSITGAASSWVAAELLSHLASPSDSSYRAALAGVRRLVEHCRYYNGSRYVLPFVADTDSQVAYIIFNYKLVDDAERAGLASLCGAVYETAPEELEKYDADLAHIKRQVDEAEVGFVRNIWENIILKLVPDAVDWAAMARNRERQQTGLAELRSFEAVQITASVIVSRVAKKIGIELSDKEREGKIAETIKHLSPAIRLQNAVLSHILETSLDLRKSKNRNTLWDIHIAFAVSTFAQLGVIPAWLVTNDRVVLKAAQEAGMDWAVHSLDSYENVLQKPSLLIRPV